MRLSLSKNFSRGFTLIELLVVAIILCILALVLLSAIDPVEQQLKATDSAAEDTAASWIAANYRYYGAKAQYPWYPTPGCYAAPTVSVGVGSLGPNSVTTAPVVVLPTLVASECATILIGNGELKSSFYQIDPGIIDKIYLNQPAEPSGSPTSISACYRPQSKAEYTKHNVLFNKDGSRNSSCPGGPDCYYCAF